MFTLNLTDRRLSGRRLESVGFDDSVEVTERRFVLHEEIAPIGASEERIQRGLSFGGVAITQLFLGRCLLLAFAFPANTLPFFVMGVDPIRRHPFVLNRIHQERGWRGFETREAVRLLVHGGVGDTHPALDQSPAALLEQPPNPRFVDADRLQWLIKRIVDDRLL